MLASAAGASAARADSIVYEKAGDVWLTTPDGSRTFRVTSSGGYLTPSQSDDGTIVAVKDGQFHRMDRSGQLLGEPFYPGVPGGPDIGSPYDPVISPDGTKIAYWYIIKTSHYDRECGCNRTRMETSWHVTLSDRYTKEGYGSDGRYVGGGAYSEPSWIGNDRLLANTVGINRPLKDVAVDDVIEQKTTFTQGHREWFSDEAEPDVTLSDGELSGDLKRLAYIASDYQSDGPPNMIRFYTVGQLPAGDGSEAPVPPTPLCTISVPTEKFADLTWAPDNARLAWSVEGSGVYVATAPDASCAAPDPRLIAAGGTDPDWGPADVPVVDGPSGLQLGSLRLTPASFRTGAQGGTSISYTLSDLAAVAFIFERVLPGRRSGSRCVAPRQSSRSAKSCKRYKRVPGGLGRQSTAGPNSFRFTGRVQKRTLAPGSYRLSAVAVDAANNQSKLAQRNFKVVR